MSLLLYGLLTGFLFGFLIQKGQIIRYEKQIGALLFKDMTIVKFYLSATIVAMVGLFLLRDLGYIKLDIQMTLLGTNIIGGLIFGLGWGLVGYCPVTQVAALAEGRLDSLWAIVGMLAGAFLYSKVYPFLKNTIMTWGHYGNITLPNLLGHSHWIIIAIFTIIALILFLIFERKSV